MLKLKLGSSQIITSTDATVATKVSFPSPIYLEPDQEYSLLFLHQHQIYMNYGCARMGERTVNTTTLPDAESVIVTKQYIGGSLFKSQNGTIWTASQFEDMKFKLYKCNFTQHQELHSSIILSKILIVLHQFYSKIQSKLYHVS